MAEKTDLLAKINQAAEKIKGLYPELPKTCIVLGSGLAPMAERCEVLAEIPYSQIPHFPVSTVPGHDGVLVIGRIGKTLVYLMKGRFHYYEGYSTVEVTFPFRVLAQLGLRRLLLTNAAGGLNPAMKPGDLMLIRDHISFFCDSPLRGENLEAFGPRFPDQTYVYTPELIEQMLDISQKLHTPIHVGVYGYMRGPQFETPAEIKALRLLGTDAAGMSTVPEAIVASHSGMQVLALSCITNLAAGISDLPLTHTEVMETGAAASAKTIALLEAFLREVV